MQRAARLSVGLRVLKNQTGAVLRRVRAGETVELTDRGRPIALILPLGGGSAADLASTLRELAASGRITWSGGKPRGLASPPKVRGASVADAVIEDRR